MHRLDWFVDIEFADVILVSSDILSKVLTLVPFYWRYFVFDFFCGTTLAYESQDPLVFELL